MATEAMTLQLSRSLSTAESVPVPDGWTQLLGASIEPQSLDRGIPASARDPVSSPTLQLSRSLSTAESPVSIGGGGAVPGLQLSRSLSTAESLRESSIDAIAAVLLQLSRSLSTAESACRSAKVEWGLSRFN